MALIIGTINVNGLQNKTKRDRIFTWLIEKKIDLICLQETHCTREEINDWQIEWKNHGGGESEWSCGTSDSRGVGILLSENFPANYKFHVRNENKSREINLEISTETAIYHFTNVYAPNNGTERKHFFNSLHNSFEFSDDSIDHYNLVLGDFNCCLDKKLDRSPPHTSDDTGLKELKDIILRYDLNDIWRINFSDVKRFSFRRGNSKSRIDYILCSSSLNSKMYNLRIQHFPFSDHDLVLSKLKLDEIERGPGLWAMNVNTIKTDEFRNAFTTFWESWKNTQNNYENVREWWDITKTKIKFLTMEISKTLNKKLNDIKNLENKLDMLKSKEHQSENTERLIAETEFKIKTYYENKTEAAKIRSRVKWAEDGEKSTKFFFDLEKKNGQNKLWNRIKTLNGKYKYDIDSIINEQVDFYSKLFKSEGWDENHAAELCQHIENKLNLEDRQMLDSDLNITEI